MRAPGVKRHPRLNDEKRRRPTARAYHASPTRTHHAHDARAHERSDTNRHRRVVREHSLAQVSGGVARYRSANCCRQTWYVFPPPVELLTHCLGDFLLALHQHPYHPPYSHPSLLLQSCLASPAALPSSCTPTRSAVRPRLSAPRTRRPGVAASSSSRSTRSRSTSRSRSTMTSTTRRSPSPRRDSAM